MGGERIFFVACGLFLVSMYCVRADDPDLHRNVTQLIASHGYPVEEHIATTPDGYLLSMQRIPHGRVRSRSRGPYPVVFLQHGVLDSSNTWVLNSVTESLAFILADAGFDVWLGNNRGNCYSQYNTHLSPDDVAFWAFSYDEMAKYDLPTQISYALQISGVSKLAAYIGHSQGTTQAFIAFSENYGQIADKVGLFGALAPVAHLGHMSNILFKALAELRVDQLLSILGEKRFLPSSDVLKKLLPDLCKVLPSLCENAFCLSFGCDSKFLNQSRLPVYTSHVPCGTSVQDMVHFAQAVRTNAFQAFDYGTKGNQEKYGQPTPPQYSLQQMRVKTALFYGGRDTLGDPTDVQAIVDALPHDMNVWVQEENDYGHLEFVWGTDANTRIYAKLIDLIRKFGT